MPRISSSSSKYSAASGKTQSRFKRDGRTEDRKAPNAMHIKRLTGTNRDGFYWVDDSINGASQVYCYMEIDGGGWMLLTSATSNISTVSKGSCSWYSPGIGFQIPSTLNVGIAESGCGTNVNQYILSSFLNYSEATLLMERVSSIGQCPAVNNAVSSGYYSGTYDGSITNSSMCTWGDGVWANSTNASQDMNGLQLFWAIKMSGSEGFELSYGNNCGASGTGTHYHRWWVR